MNTHIKNILGIFIAMTLLVVAVIGVFEIKTRASGRQDIAKTPTISMSGAGKVSATPDTATLSFSVVTNGKKAEDVQKDNDKKMTDVKNYLKSAGVEEKDIQTSNYNLYPQYTYHPDGSAPDIVGYNLTQSVITKVRKLDKVQSLVGGLTSKGINQIDSISFSLDDPNILKDQARTMAVEKAKTKAQDLASKLGVKLGKVVNFYEAESSAPYPLPYAGDKGYGYGGESPISASPIQPGSLDIISNVTLIFELK